MTYPKYPVWRDAPDPQDNAIARMEELKRHFVTFYFKKIARIVAMEFDRHEPR
jgi:hypothetical protein